MIKSEIIFWLCWFTGWAIVTFGAIGLVFWIVKAIMRDVITVKQFLEYRRKAELYDQENSDK